MVSEIRHDSRVDVGGSKRVRHLDTNAGLAPMSPLGVVSAIIISWTV